MITRGRSGIFKPHLLHASIKHPLPDDVELTCVSKDLPHPRWCTAMSDEFLALLKHGSWTLVDPSQNANIIGCKWIFQIKRKPDGSVDKYKARLVAKGFHQCPGVDYDEIFSLVVKLIMI